MMKRLSAFAGNWEINTTKGIIVIQKATIFTEAQFINRAIFIVPNSIVRSDIRVVFITDISDKYFHPNNWKEKPIND